MCIAIDFNVKISFSIAFKNDSESGPFSASLIDGRSGSFEALALSAHGVCVVLVGGACEGPRMQHCFV